MWAYSYQIMPPQPRRRLDAIREVLDHEYAAARHEARIWAGRLVLERRATRILIVSDSPDQEREVNHTLAGEVRRLQATYSCTGSVEIAVKP